MQKNNYSKHTYIHTYIHEETRYLSIVYNQILHRNGKWKQIIMHRKKINEKDAAASFLLLLLHLIHKAHFNNVLGKIDSHNSIFYINNWNSSVSRNKKLKERKRKREKQKLKLLWLPCSNALVWECVCVTNNQWL